MSARVAFFCSLQSDYCHFLLDRLLGLAMRGRGKDTPLSDTLAQCSFEQPVRRMQQYGDLP